MTLKEQSVAWWNRTKASEEAINTWLSKQYVGEHRAYMRLLYYLAAFEPTVNVHRVVMKIAKQELKHANWLGKLLAVRRVVADNNHQDRYWKHTLEGIKSFDQMCGVAWAAESMRLARIEAIAEDKTAPKDIRQTFQKILKDERFHEKAFRSLSTPASKTKALKNHKKGLKAIGLEP